MVVTFFVHPIHTWRSRFRNAAIHNVMRHAPKGNIWSVPKVLGIGIGEGHVKVTVLGRHSSHSCFPGEVNGIPVVLEERDQPTHHSFVRGNRPTTQGAGNRGGGTLQGGAECPSGCCCTGIVKDLAGANYLLSAAHCFGKTNPTITFGGKTVAQFTKSAIICGQNNNHLDAGIAKILPGVIFSTNIIGLGAPNGLAQPAIGDTATIQGPFAGKVSGKITTISYSFKDAYPEISSGCNVTHVNIFEANLGKIGDSGAATWNQAGKLIGIDFSGDGIEQFSNINFLQTDLGVHF